MEWEDCEGSFLQDVRVVNSREFALLRTFWCYLGIKGSLLIANCNDLLRLRCVVSVFISLRIYLFVLPVAKVLAVREETLFFFLLTVKWKVFLSRGEVEWHSLYRTRCAPLVQTFAYREVRRRPRKKGSIKSMDRSSKEQQLFGGSCVYATKDRKERNEESTKEVAFSFFLFYFCACVLLFSLLCQSGTHPGLWADF